MINEYLITEAIEAVVKSFINDENKSESLETYEKINDFIKKIPEEQIIMLTKVNGSIVLIQANQRDIKSAKPLNPIEIQKILDKIVSEI